MTGNSHYQHSPSVGSLPVQLVEATEQFILSLTQTIREAAKAEWVQLEAEKQSNAHQPPLTVEQAAHLLDVSIQTVHIWRKQGKLPSYKLGGRVYLKHSEVMAALESQSLPDGRRKYSRRRFKKKGV